MTQQKMQQIQEWINRATNPTTGYFAMIDIEDQTVMTEASIRYLNSIEPIYDKYSKIEMKMTSDNFKRTIFEKLFQKKPDDQ